MPFGLIYFLLIPLGLVVAFYLIIPLILRSQQRYPASPQLLEMRFESLKPSLAKFLMTRTHALFELGFEEATLVKIPDPAPHVRTYLVMLVNRPAGDKAMVTAIVGDAGPGARKQTLYVEFSTRFETGEVFDTHNADELNAFPPAPLAVRTQTPSVLDPAELYHLHRFVMKKHDVRSAKTLYERGQSLDYLVRFAFVKSYEEQVKRGWLWYDEADDSYRMTILGSYLICWGLLQPFKAFRRLALQSRERRILAEFDATRDQRRR